MLGQALGRQTGREVPAAPAWLAALVRVWQTRDGAHGCENGLIFQIVIVPLLIHISGSAPIAGSG